MQFIFGRMKLIKTRRLIIIQAKCTDNDFNRKQRNNLEQRDSQWVGINATVTMFK